MTTKRPTIDLAPLEGRPLGDGCEDCDADMAVRADPEYPGMWVLDIRHDDGCPFLAARMAAPTPATMRPSRSFAVDAMLRAIADESQR